MNEAVPQQENSGPKEAARIEADPTTYSPLDLRGEKTDLGRASEIRENRLIGSHGETYVRLDRGEHDASQYVTAKLLKGIVNVADVVKDEHGVFYSKVMSLDAIQESTSNPEIEGDIFILKALVGDGDHEFSPESENLKGYMRNVTHGNGKTAYFDFGYTRDLNANINTAEQARYVGIEALDHASAKLDALYNRLNGTMGTVFLKSIIKSSGYSVKDIFPSFGEVDSADDLDIRTLQVALLDKIHEAHSEIFNRKAELRRKAA